MSLFHCLHPGLPTWKIQRDGFYFAIGFDVSSRSLQVPSYTFSNPSSTICPFLVHQNSWKAFVSFVSLQRIHPQWMCSNLSPQQIHEEIQEHPWALAFPKILLQIPSRLLLLQCMTAMRIQTFCLSFHWMEFLSSSRTKFSSPGGSGGKNECLKRQDRAQLLYQNLLIKSWTTTVWEQLSK